VFIEVWAPVWGINQDDVWRLQLAGFTCDSVIMLNNLLSRRHDLDLCNSYYVVYIIGIWKSQDMCILHWLQTREMRCHLCWQHLRHHNMRRWLTLSLTLSAMARRCWLLSTLMQSVSAVIIWTRRVFLPLSDNSTWGFSRNNIATTNPSLTSPLNVHSSSIFAVFFGFHILLF